MQGAGLDVGLVGCGVLAGVIDQRQVVAVGGQGSPPLHELGDDPGELGDVGPVAGIGVRTQGDAAVGGDHQTETDKTQVGPFLFGMAPLGDRGPVVGRVDVGREVGHVQHQA